jgi:L-iditol 2-dehydrogenase
MPPREGAFAGLLAMPERNLVVIPDHVTTHQAALAEPIACGWHGVRLGRAVLGDGPHRALVLGGGAIGLGAALSLAAQGIRDVTMVEPHAARRAFLDLRCDQKTLAPDALDPAEQFDIVVDGVGYEATRAQASAHARPGGVIVHIGLGQSTGGLDIRRMTLQEITFIGTYTYTAQDFRDCAQAMFEVRLGALDWVEERALSEGAGAFADIRSGRVTSPKIILVP